MTIDDVLGLLGRELSGVRAHDAVARVAQHHRIQGSPGLLDAMHEVQSLLAAGDVETVLHRYPADGTSSAFGWASPPYWDVRGGTLDLVEPEAKCLARFDEVAQTIIAHSPGGTVEGALFHVGDGSREQDYDGLEVSSGLVLAHGTVRDVARLASSHGAKAVIIYPQGPRAAASYDLVQYLSFFPEQAEIDGLPMGFSVSRRIADELIAALERGAVRLACHVEATLGTGPLPVLEAWIPGTEPGAREVLLTAHLCHPRQSANDNASGSGALVEVARALRRLTKEGAVDLRRTVRFLWVPEFFGTLFWADEHREVIERVLFSLNLDMVGQSPERIGTPLEISSVPSSLASVLDTWFEPLLERIAADRRTVAPHGTRRRMHWVLTPPCGGSDHVVFTCRPFFVPAAMVGHQDPYWHTDRDTLELVDPTELKRVAVLAATLCLLPDRLSTELPRLEGWLLRYSTRRMTVAGETARSGPDRLSTRLADLALQTERRRADRFAALADEEGVAWDGTGHRAALDAVHAAVRSDRGDASPGGGGDTPRAVRDGPLPRAFAEGLSRDERCFLDDTFTSGHRMMLEQLVDLCDGKRAVDDLALHLALDFGTWIDPDDMLRALELLARGGYVAS